MATHDDAEVVHEMSIPELASLYLRITEFEHKLNNSEVQSGAKIREILFCPGFNFLRGGNISSKMVEEARSIIGQLTDQIHNQFGSIKPLPDADISHESTKRTVDEFRAAVGLNRLVPL